MSLFFTEPDTRFLVTRIQQIIYENTYELANQRYVPVALRTYSSPPVAQRCDRIQTMADDGSLDALQALRRELNTVVDALKKDREAGRELLFELPQNPLLEALRNKFRRLLEKPGRKKESRDAILSGLFMFLVDYVPLTDYLCAGKVTISNEEYSFNKDFQELVLQVADELDLDEIEAAKLTILAEDDESTLERSRRECAIIRFHTERIRLLECIVLLLELTKEEDELLAEGIADDIGYLGQYVSEHILRVGPPGAPRTPAHSRFVPVCTTTMHDIRMWLQKLSDLVTSGAMLGRTDEAQFQETVKFTYMSLTQQHEYLAVILSYAIEKHVAIEEDFIDFLRVLKRATRYDPPLGEFLK